MVKCVVTSPSGAQSESQPHCSHHPGMDGTAQRKSESLCLSGPLSSREAMLSISQLVHKRLGTQTLGLLVEVEQEKTEKRLAHILPLLLASLTVGEGEQDTKRPCKNQPLEVSCIGRRRQRKDVLNVENESHCELFSCHVVYALGKWCGRVPWSG